MGTSVYKGYFEKRDVAVKRYLKSNWSETAQNEADCLIMADFHPNIISYYCTEKSIDFIFLGLQRCQTNLKDLMAGNGPKLTVNPVVLSGDILEGLSHLHNLRPRKIIHRDLKPSNILLSVRQPNCEVRGIIADLGLSKQLEEATRETFSVTAGKAAGSRGWQAAELLEMLDRTTSDGRQHLSVKLDIFPTGCLMFFLMTEGKHPFGERLSRREANILDNRPDLSALKNDYQVYENLIRSLISYDPNSRPTAKDALECFKSLCKNSGIINCKLC